jgi:hypothetical protein
LRVFSLSGLVAMSFMAAHPAKATAAAANKAMKPDLVERFICDS